MAEGRIMVGYGSDTRPKGKPKAYGGSNTGKYRPNGGFNNQPTVSFESVDDEKWEHAFPNSYKPSWLKNE